MPDMDLSPHIVKVGGSLLDLPDLPDLPDRLDRWLTAHGGPKVMLVVGGGAIADFVRQWDRHHRLDESKAHWIAIDAMALNTRLLTDALPRAVDVSKPHSVRIAWADGLHAVMQPKAWLMADHANGRTIPHRWSFTSDSLAAYLATRMRAPRLTLLKSRLPVDDEGKAVTQTTIANATEAGLVDTDLAEWARAIAHVRLVNLRDDVWPTCEMAWA